jgi:hypothetical protein
LAICFGIVNNIENLNITAKNIYYHVLAPAMIVDEVVRLDGMQ